MPATTTLNGQILGMAERAAHAVLERVAASFDLTARESIALNLLATSGGQLPADQLIARMGDGLKISESAVLEVVGSLLDAGLVDSLPPSRLALSAAGQERNQRVRTALGEVTGRLYGDIPAEDLETAGRVLLTLTERANAELAA